MFQPIAMSRCGKAHDISRLGEQPSSGLVEIYALDVLDDLPELSSLVATLATAQDARTGELNLSALLDQLRADRRLALAGAFHRRHEGQPCDAAGMTMHMREAVDAASLSQLPPSIWPQLEAKLARGHAQGGDGKAVCGTAAGSILPTLTAVLVAPRSGGRARYELAVLSLVPLQPADDAGIKPEPGYSVRTMVLVADIGGQGH